MVPLADQELSHHAGADPAHAAAACVPALVESVLCADAGRVGGKESGRACLLLSRLLLLDPLVVRRVRCTPRASSCASIGACSSSRGSSSSGSGGRRSGMRSHRSSSTRQEQQQEQELSQRTQSAHAWPVQVGAEWLRNGRWFAPWTAPRTALAAGRLTQGVPGVPQDPLAPRP
jgi:hypothetical protein